MGDPLALLITAIGGFVAASSGFWVYLRNRDSAKNATTRLLMGLAHDKITFFGMQYIDRGYVTKDEYEDLRRYFYEPYIELGGNGTAERIMHAMQQLPLRSKGDHHSASDLRARLRIEAQSELNELLRDTQPHREGEDDRDANTGTGTEA